MSMTIEIFSREIFTTSKQTIELIIRDNVEPIESEINNELKQYLYVE